jgi:ribosomal silencing factor RsfS
LSSFYRVLLTHDEIKEALIAQGGIDVVVVEMREPIESMTHLILASGRSTRHLRKMSDTIVQAVSSI